MLQQWRNSPPIKCQSVNISHWMSIYHIICQYMTLSVTCASHWDKHQWVPYPLLSWSTFSHTPHPYQRGQSAVLLDTRLVQKRVYHCCSAENGPLSASGQLPTSNRTTTVSIVSTLWRQRRDSTASAPVLSDSHASTHLHQLHRLYRPTTHDELPGDDWGGDTSPRPGMREREHLWVIYWHSQWIISAVELHNCNGLLRCRWFVPRLIN